MVTVLRLNKDINLRAGSLFQAPWRLPKGPIRNTLGLAREMGTVLIVAEPGRIKQAQAGTEGCGRGVSKGRASPAVPPQGWVALKDSRLWPGINPSILPFMRAACEQVTVEPSF